MYLIMKFRIHRSNVTSDFISSKLSLVTNNINNNKVIAKSNIFKDELLIIEYPSINLFGECVNNRELKTLKKYIENKHLQSIIDLYPRDYSYTKTSLVKSIQKLIKNVKSTDYNLFCYFHQFSSDELEFYFAKYIYNAFEGNDFGPLTLPFIAKLNHSCNPNVKFIFNKLNGSMYVYSVKNINKGEEIFDSYLENKTIFNHKDYLSNHYGFVCSCD